MFSVYVVFSIQIYIVNYKVVHITVLMVHVAVSRTTAHSRNECYCPRTVGISYVYLHK